MPQGRGTYELKKKKKRRTISLILLLKSHFMSDHGKWRHSFKVHWVTVTEKKNQNRGTPLFLGNRRDSWGLFNSAVWEPPGSIPGHTSRRYVCTRIPWSTSDLNYSRVNPSKSIAPHLRCDGQSFFWESNHCVSSREHTNFLQHPSHHPFSWHCRYQHDTAEPSPRVTDSTVHWDERIISFVIAIGELIPADP